MPTKPNKAGQQQPYVPQGNGDASGEYADNQSGSNKHFTNFKQPEQPKAQEPQIEEPKINEPKINEPKGETQVEQPKEPEQVKSRWNELSKKQKKDLGNYLNRVSSFMSQMSDYEKNNMIRLMRYYGGNEMEGFTDEDLLNMANEFQNLPKSDNYVYFKDGAKWKLTKNTGLLEKQGIPYYTQEQREQLEKEKNKNLYEKSQSEGDKAIQKIMGNKCVVCFGKGYSKEDIAEIETATKVLVNDWGELTNYVENIGDRNNLGKYLTAMNSQKEFSEEEIAAQIEKERKRYWFGLPPEEKLREDAIKSLQNPVEFRIVGNAYAYWSSSRKSMIFQGIMKRYTEETSKREYDAGFKSSDKKISVYYHEMGHAVDSMIESMYENKMKSFRSAGNYDYDKIKKLERIAYDFNTEKSALISQNFNENFSVYKLRDEFQKRYGYAYTYNYENELKMNEIKNELHNKGEREYRLSKYGATNNQEFVAESFAAHYTGMNNQLATSLVKLYQKYYKEIKEFQ